MNDYAMLMLAAILLAGGCGKKEDVKPAAPLPSLMQPGDPLPPSAPTPALPAPNVPKGAVAPSPQVGQAGDHSSPGFKEGGKPDLKK
jgi:hypothetical protein